MRREHPQSEGYASVGGAVSEQSGNSGGDGCLGCITLILACIAFWALLFGVTVGGRHYQIVDCSTERGVEVVP